MRSGKHPRDNLSPSKALRFPDEPANSVYNFFQQGDLLFGLRGSKAPVKDKLKKEGFHHLYANDLNCPVVEHVLKGDSDSEKKTAALDEQQQKYYQFLKSHRAYLLREAGKPASSISPDPVISAAYRRACKLLLINREPDRTAKVHVITQGILWKRVCDKEQSQQGITDSEMRAAYRDNHDNGPNPHVFFYDENNQRLKRPPWKQNRFKGHWEKYDTQRQQKKKRLLEEPLPQDNLQDNLEENSKKCAKIK